MKIAALQTVSTPDPDRNLEAAARLIAEAVREGAALVALPEYFCLMGHRDEDKLGIAEPAGGGPIQDFLAGQARRHGVWLIGGTLPIQGTTPGRVYNACCVHAPDGSLAARYDKVHLFRYDNGRESYDEARVLVVPEINAGTATLAYAVINPAIGLGAFAAQWFLRRPLMAANTREFHVQGSWADPKVERVERQIDAPLPDIDTPAAASAPRQ